MKISIPLRRALDAAGIEPARLNQTLEKRIRTHEGALVEGDHFPELIRAATALKVERIGRGNHHILLRFGGKAAGYHEYSRNNCVLNVYASIPLSAVTGAIGKPLEALIGLDGAMTFLKGVSIIGLAASNETCTSIAVDPGWSEIQ